MSTRIQRILNSSRGLESFVSEAMTQQEIDEINDQVVNVEIEQYMQDAEDLLTIADSLESICLVCSDEDFNHPVTQAALEGFGGMLGVDVCQVSTENAVTDTIKRIYDAIKAAIEKAIAIVVIWVLKFASRSKETEKRIQQRLKRIKGYDADRKTVKVEVEDNLDQLAVGQRVDLELVVSTSDKVVSMLDALSKEAEDISKRFIKESDAKGIIEIEDAIDTIGERVISRFFTLKETDEGFESKDLLPGNVRLMFNFKQKTPTFAFRKEEGDDNIILRTTLEEIIEAMEIAGSKSMFANLTRHLNTAKENDVAKALDNRVSKLKTGSNESSYVKSYILLGGRVNALSTLPGLRISQYAATLASHLENVAGVVEKAVKQ